MISARGKPEKASEREREHNHSGNCEDFHPPQACQGMFLSLICIKSENNHSFAAMCLKALKLGKPMENDDLNSFLV